MSKLLINGAWVDGAATEELFDKYTHQPFGQMGIASAAQVEAAVEGALRGFQESTLDPSDRSRILARAAELVTSWRDRFLETITHETGFTRSDGEGEVRRCAQTLLIASEEAKRLQGSVIPMDATPGLKQRMGYTILVPRGVVCAITPYNSPLNTVAHKVAPALAGGNAVVLKPSEFTPLTASLLCEALLEAGLPPRLISLVHGTGQDVGRLLLKDQRIAFYTFTGSTRVGKEIQAAAGLRGTQLELGSIASTIVCDDADLGLAIPKLAGASFRKAGQVCTSVQRILVQRGVAAEFTEKFLKASSALAFGDPSQPGTVVGPMISIAQAERAQKWIQDAIAGGAKLLMGGKREGAMLEPTVLADVQPSMQVVCQEVFAPVVSIMEFGTLEEAVAMANNTPYGLAVGLFTANLGRALKATHMLDFGGIHINETSSSRVDVMPFGGVKDSGFGREGPAYAMREMMQERLVTIAY